MSRTSLHRPRRNRAVWDRPAADTRLLPYPFPPTIPHLNPHYKRCPKAHRLRLSSDQSLSLPVHVTGYGRFPDKKRLALSKGHCQVRAPLTRRIPSPLRRRPRAQRHVCSPGPSRPGLPRPRPCGEAIGPSDTAGFHRRQERSTPVTHAISVWSGTSGGRDCPTPRFLASLPRPLRSTGLSQSRRRCGTSAVADNTHRYRRRRLPAQPSGTFHPLPLPLYLSPPL